MEKNLEFIENYEELAGAIIESAISEWVEGHWWLKHPFIYKKTPKEVTERHHRTNIVQAETFFNSLQFEEYTNCHPTVRDYIFEKMNKTINRPERYALVEQPILDKETKEPVLDKHGQPKTKVVKTDMVYADIKRLAADVMKTIRRE